MQSMSKQVTKFCTTFTIQWTSGINQRADQTTNREDEFMLERHASVKHKKLLNMYLHVRRC